MPNVDMDAYGDRITEELAKDFAVAQAALSSDACCDKSAVRRQDEPAHPAYPQFARDTERILNCRYFNRYADKTQAFSLYQNDDITRRMQHVQIVSQIARTIGRMLKLNQDLIEAIALGHDLGHAPFGHLGERILSRLLEESAGMPFRHNVQSVRVADRLLNLNLSVQTLDGILCHNGRTIGGPYYPDRPAHDGHVDTIRAFDQKYHRAERGEADHVLVASTLEGCVVRFADTISYIRKDRQDAVLLGVESHAPSETDRQLEASDGTFVFNMVANIVKNSYGKPYLCLDDDVARALQYEKKANYDMIYSRQNDPQLYGPLEGMFGRVYKKCVDDVRACDKLSPIWRHHVRKSAGSTQPDDTNMLQYLQDGPERIAADYIASMTDDYFVDLHEYLFPGVATLRYESYFRKEKPPQAEGGREGDTNT